MALSGSFSTNITTAGGQLDERYARNIVVSWSATQNVANNTSTISWSVKTGDSTNGYCWVIVRNVKVVINGVTVYSSGANGIECYRNQTLASGTMSPITHSSNGTKSVAVSASAAFYTSSENSTYSGNITLNTIPRTSSFSLSASSVEIGKALTVNISRASSSFTHSVRIWCDWNSYYSVKSGVATSTSFTIPNTWYEKANGASSITAYCRVETYSGSTLIGTAADKSFTVTIPSSVKPSIEGLTLTPTAVNGRSILIQNKNALTISATGCTGGLGSAISYTITGTDISTRYASSVTVGPFHNSGTKTYTLTVTDAGGRTATKTAEIPCYEYGSPSIKTFTAFRCNANGVADNKGTYIKCSYTMGYSAVNNTNRITVKIYYKQSASEDLESVEVLTNGTATSGSKLLSSIKTNYGYTVYATITDSYGGSSQSTSATIFGASRILNITSDGTGVAIGKMAESKQQFEVRWPTKLDDTLTVGTSTQDSTPTKGIAIHDVRNVQDNITPDSFGDKNVNFYFTDFGEKDRWKSVVHMKGWSGNTYTAWELAGDAGLSNQNENVLKYRQGIGSTWGAWRTILTEPTVLFSSATGSVGTITLLYSAANYAYLEIYYSDNNNRQPNCVRVFSPDGKYVTLACIEPSTSSEEPRIYIRSSAWTISGTSMTTGRTDLSGANNGVYAQIYPQAGGANTNIDVKVEKNEYIKIFRVLGYS